MTTVPKLGIVISEPPEVFDDLIGPLAGEYDEHDLHPKALVVVGPFDGEPRLADVEVAEVRLQPRYTGETFANLEHGSVTVGGYIVTTTGEKRPFIGKVHLLP